MSQESLILIGFPDEISWRTRGEAAVALLRVATTAIHGPAKPAPREDTDTSQGEEASASAVPEPAAGKVVTVLARVHRADRASLEARTPETAALKDSTVAVIGLGALGGPFALELARCGVGRLDLLDGQTHKVENLSRQVPGLSYVSWPKSLAIETLVHQAALLCQAKGHWVQLGCHDPAEHTSLLEIIAKADLVCDLTASLVVTRFLAAHCRTAGRPLLVASATHGAWGGVVTLLEPSATRPCWGCVELHRRDRALPVPAALSSTPATGLDQAPDPAPVAAGCGSPSFTGTAADLAAVWQHAVRVAVGRLRQQQGAPGWFEQDYFALSLRNDVGGGVPASWQAMSLLPHQGCPRHPPSLASAVRQELQPARAPQ
jgi:hypothetical protein